MKIDRSNLGHWWLLTMFGFNVVTALILRAFARRSDRSQIILYGHKLNGNLLSIYHALKKNPTFESRVVFLTMDSVYHQELLTKGVDTVCATRGECAKLLAGTAAIITDHGLHAMLPLLWLSSIKFFDVWHGIPFKGFGPRDFRIQHRYDEIWVASPLHARLYTEKYGFDAGKVHVTGYSRTDRLVRQAEDEQALRRAIGAPEKGKLVLFAPTWSQDIHGRSLYPFDCTEKEFLGSLAGLAEETDATILIRAHLNSDSSTGSGYSRVLPVPYAQYPDTEAILLVSDILICDWSSIAFDYLLLNRPTIFLDVEAPFKNGFSLGPEYRFGAVVSGLPGLVDHLEDYINDPSAYQTVFGARHAKLCRDIYGSTADGHSAERCIERLTYSLNQAESFR